MQYIKYYSEANRNRKNLKITKIIHARDLRPQTELSKLVESIGVVLPSLPSKGVSRLRSNVTIDLTHKGNTIAQLAHVC